MYIWVQVVSSHIPVAILNEAQNASPIQLNLHNASYYNRKLFNDLFNFISWSKLFFNFSKKLIFF